MHYVGRMHSFLLVQNTNNRALKCVCVCGEGEGREGKADTWFICSECKIQGRHAAFLRQSGIKLSFSWKYFGFPLQIIKPSAFSDYAMYCMTLTQPLPISRLRIKTLTYEKKVLKLLFLALKFLLFLFFFKIPNNIFKPKYFLHCLHGLLLLLKNITSKEKGWDKTEYVCHLFLCHRLCPRHYT